MFGSLTGSEKWQGAVLAPNGKIYCVPRNHTQVLCIDPTNNSTTLFGNFAGATKWTGAVLAPNGKIYCAPLSHTQVLTIGTTQTIDNDAVLSRYLNKF